MSIALVKPMATLAARRSSRVWLRWGVSFLLVLALHFCALLLLRRSIAVVGPAVPEAIMLDLSPASTAPPEVAPVTPPPEPPPSPSPPPPLPPEPLPPPDPLPPDPAPPVIPDVVPPVPQAEVPLPPPRPVVKRPPPAPRPPVTQSVPRPTAASHVEPPASAPITAPAGPTASAPPGQDQLTWEGQLLAHLARFKRFPPAAERRGEQGTVMMRVIMGRSGAVLSVSMVNGSGYADLDSEAQAWIVRAEPLPAFPPEINAQQMQITIPLRFTLR